MPQVPLRPVPRNAGAFNVNDMVTDLYPDPSDHKPSKPGPAAAIERMERLAATTSAAAEQPRN